MVRFGKESKLQILSSRINRKPNCGKWSLMLRAAPSMPKAKLFPREKQFQVLYLTKKRLIAKRTFFKCIGII